MFFGVHSCHSLAVMFSHVPQLVFSVSRSGSRARSGSFEVMVSHVPVRFQVFQLPRPDARISFLLLLLPRHPVPGAFDLASAFAFVECFDSLVIRMALVHRRAEILILACGLLTRKLL